MEQLVIQHPILILLTWTLLNILLCCINFLYQRLYKNVIDFDVKSEARYGKKSSLMLLAWLIFGVVTLAAHRQAMLKGEETFYEYSVWAGAFFFLIIGYLLRGTLYLIQYFVYWKGLPKTTSSYKASTIVYSFEFFGYSALMFLGFLVSNNPFLLGGTIGLAFGGALYLLELTRKKGTSDKKISP
ncbi:MAG: hypothetical protein PHQ00_00870 [Phycisphaerae bacterium]|nr:hypothetical protein [Phycisphaerae bacterium]